MYHPSTSAWSSFAFSTTAIDTANLGHGSGVELSSLIGFETLRELVISIDYRDNLVHVVYDPKHGFHRH